jgi:hypothetical protein
LQSDHPRELSKMRLPGIPSRRAAREPSLAAPKTARVSAGWRHADVAGPEPAAFEETTRGKARRAWQPGPSVVLPVGPKREQNSLHALGSSGSKLDMVGISPFATIKR